ncbi:cytochrome P450 [Lentzea sp. NPDC004782]|uniref:cytochrome P450 n=1 Tax=Lentzea sp. NPDC004782 TaxID=3154458 RepID=UPI0033B85A2F
MHGDGTCGTTSREQAAPPEPTLPPQLQSLLMAFFPEKFPTWLNRKHGPTWSMRTGVHGKNLVALANNEHIRQVFTTKPEKMYDGEANAIFEPPMGSSSLMLMETARHAHTRQISLRQTSREKLRSYRSTITAIISDEVERWGNHSNCWS